jgi:hypothetical protein
MTIEPTAKKPYKTIDREYLHESLGYIIASLGLILSKETDDEEIFDTLVCKRYTMDSLIQEMKNDN